MFALAGWKIYKKRVAQKQTEPIWKQRGIGCVRPRVGAWVGIERNCPEPTLSKAHRPHIPIPDCFYSFPSHNAHKPTPSHP